MACSPPAKGECLEHKIIRNNLADITELISSDPSTGPTWFAQKLEEKAFVANAANAVVMGYSKSEQTSKLMEAVKVKIRTSQEPGKEFAKFLEILQSNRPLVEFAKKLLQEYNEQGTAAHDGAMSKIPTSTSSSQLQSPFDSNTPRVPPLSPYVPAPTLHAIDEYAKYLRSYYESRKLPKNLKWPPTASKIYNHLAIVKKKKVSKEQADEFTRATLQGNIDDIVREKEEMEYSGVGIQEDGSLARFILVEGAPGIGKTRFAWEVSQRWSSGEILNQYRLVVLLRLRDKRVREAKNVYDLFYHYDDKLREEVAKEIRRINGEWVLLLYEGYDELPGKLQTQESIFLEILHRECLPKATVLITSRPRATEFLQDQFKEEISQHIEILGFTSADVHSYVHDVMKDEELYTRFTKYLNCYPHIRGLMYVPLNAAIIIEIYKKHDSDEFVPTTLTELYTSLTSGMLLRYLKSHDEYGQRKWTLSDFSDLPEELKKQFHTICGIAFQGIIEGEIIFDNLSQDFNTLDLMQSVPELYVDKGAVLSHNFFHLTLQEFLAALHVSQQPTEEQLKHFIQTCHEESSSESLHTVQASTVTMSVSTISSSHEQASRRKLPLFTFDHFQSVQRFTAGLTKFEFENITMASLKSILLQEEGEQKHITLNSLHWLFEAKCFSTYSEMIGQTTELTFKAQCISTYSQMIGQTTELTSEYGKRITPFDSYVLGYALSHINCAWHINLSKTYIGDEGVAMLVAGMKHEYSKATNPQSIRLNLSHCDITSDGIKNMNEEIPPKVAASITELVLSWNREINEGVASLLGKLKSLKALDLTGTNLSPQEIAQLTKSLSPEVLKV